MAFGIGALGGTQPSLDIDSLGSLDGAGSAKQRDKIQQLIEMMMQGIGGGANGGGGGGCACCSGGGGSCPCCDQGKKAAGAARSVLE